MKKSTMHTTAAIIGALHGVNRYIDSTIEANATKLSGKIYHWKQGDVFYKVSGEGSPLLLIHDLNVFSSEYEWKSITAALSENHTVYAIDLPGCGRSDKPAITYTSYFYVQLVADFTKSIIKEKTTVVTSGLSASFAVLANSMHKSLFQRIIMINPPSLSTMKIGPTNRSKVIMCLMNLPIFGKTYYYFSTNKNNTEYYLSEKCFYNPFNLRETETKASYLAAHYGKGSGKYLFASLNGNYLNADLTAAIKNTDTQLELIIGEHEPYAKEIMNGYKELNDTITVTVIPETKKFPHMEAPDKIIAQIITEEETQ
ncbi:MAG: alpha/beta fold hydrolase [Lachnospiraceae bacterium]|nr:alpha/beta fold hydrolase [Lachnospiraceae bacterium]